MVNEEEEDICCICKHKLSVHIDEGSGFRCHSIGTEDGFQCECYLRKGRDKDIGDLEFYSLYKRIKVSMGEK